MTAPDETPGTRVRPTRSETRRRVLDAAYAVFVDRGIATSSLADVADRAGLTKGAIYSNFSGKDELVLALMEERVLDRLTTAVARFTAACENTPERDLPLVEVGRVLVEAMRADVGWHRLLAEYYAMSARDPGRRPGLAQRRREARDSVARALDRVEATGVVRLPLPAAELAVVLFSLSNGLAIESDIDPGAVPDDLFGRVLALLVAGGASAASADPSR